MKLWIFIYETQSKGWALINISMVLTVLVRYDRFLTRHIIDFLNSKPLKSGENMTFSSLWWSTIFPQISILNDHHFSNEMTWEGHILMD